MRDAVRPSEVDFCLVEKNADVIAHLLVGRLHHLAADMESAVNRLYRGRRHFALNDTAQIDLDKVVGRLGYMIETLREVRKAQAEAAGNS